MAGSAVKDVNVYSAVRWSAVAKYGAQAVDFVTSIIVARLVMPEAYGLMSMALVVVGFVNVLQGLGFGPAIIRRKRLSQSLLSTLFCANLAFSVVLAVAVTLAAPLMSSIYGEPRVKAIVIVLVIPFFCSCLATIPTAILTRKLRFRSLAIVDILAAVVRLAVGVTLARLGWEVWALVGSSAASSGIHTIATWLSAGWRPRMWFRMKQLLTVLEFSGSVTATSIVIYFSRSGIDFLVGFFLGPSALGTFSIATRIMLFPREAIADVVMRVFFPVFSKLQHDNEALLATYGRVLGAIAFLAFPCVFGVVSVAPLLIEVLLGPKWKPAVPVIVWLSGVAALYPLFVPTTAVLMAKGKASLILGLEITRAALTLCAIAIACHWDVATVAAAWTGSNVVMAFPTYRALASRLPGISVTDIFATVFPYVCGCLFMVLFVIAIDVVLAFAGVPSIPTLVILVTMGALLYGGVVLAMRAPAIRYFWKLVVVSQAAGR